LYSIFILLSHHTVLENLDHDVKTKVGDLQPLLIVSVEEWRYTVNLCQSVYQTDIDNTYPFLRSFLHLSGDQVRTTRFAGISPAATASRCGR